MDQIYPSFHGDITPRTLLTDDLMARRGMDRARPWVMANMIMSVDGAYARDGRSGGLGGAADKATFHTLRGLADVILVGAGTARQERYRRPSSDEDTAAERIARGQEQRPGLALISQSGHFPSDQPFLTGTGPDPIVFLPHRDGDGTGPVEHLDGLEYLHAGEGSVDLHEVLDQLGRGGARLVLCEGGPHLLGDLAAEGLLDQLFITVAPQIVAGSHTGLLGERPELTDQLELNTVVTDDGYLLLNYTIRH